MCFVLSFGRWNGIIIEEAPFLFCGRCCKIGTLPFLCLVHQKAGSQIPAFGFYHSHFQFKINHSISRSRSRSKSRMGFLFFSQYVFVSFRKGKKKKKMSNFTVKKSAFADSFCLDSLYTQSSARHSARESKPKTAFS